MRGGLEDITFLGLLVFSFGLVFLVFAIVSTNLFPKLGDVLIDNANGNAVLINIGNTYKFELPFQYIEIFDKAIVYMTMFSFLAMLFFASRIKTHPLGFVFTVVFFFIGTLIAYVVNQLWNEMGTLPTISAYVGLLQGTTETIGMLPFMVLIFGAAMLIFLYLRVDQDTVL